MAKVTKEVVGALIERDGKFLVAKRNEDDSFGGLWEFPGGCIEKGETKEEALKREIKEELDMDIEVGELLLQLSDEIPALKINISLFRSSVIKGDPKPIDCAETRWLGLGELSGVDLAPADKKILKWMERSGKFV